jgi:hypothetical protein
VRGVTSQCANHRSTVYTRACEVAREWGTCIGYLSFGSTPVEYAPCVGGTSPLHLGHSMTRQDDADATLMSPRPAGRQAAIIVNSMRGWHGALVRLGGSLPPIGSQHWHVDVFSRHVGWLGTFRRSDVTGAWFQGRHSVHTAWRAVT